MKVLLIEDDPTLSRNIKEALSAEGFQVENVYDGLLAEKILKNNSFSCIILDVNLPGVNGFDLLERFRKYDTKTPVIMLTAFGELEDKVRGFDSGADDYLTKPFYLRELLLRVQSLIKRSRLGPGNHEILFAHDIQINLNTKEVSRQGKTVLLTPREFQILAKLCEVPGELVSKDDLIREIWGSALGVNTNTIEVYINLLRNKLDKPFGKNSIKTKVGFGYFLESK